MILHARAAPPFYKNGFVLGCERTREGVLIDPGDEVEELLDLVRAHRLEIKAILLTHAHMDHLTGVGRARRATGAPIHLHRDDLPLYEHAVGQGLMFGIRVEQPPPVDHFYDATPLGFGDHEIRVHHTPGHCPGGVCLEVRAKAGSPGSAGSSGSNGSPASHGPPEADASPGAHGSGASRSKLFVGDTLFAGSIGRTDLPGGDYDTLMASIRNVLFSFEDDTEVYPGHGPATTIGEERRTNPFLR